MLAPTLASGKPLACLSKRRDIPVLIGRPSGDDLGLSRESSLTCSYVRMSPTLGQATTLIFDDCKHWTPTNVLLAPKVGARFLHTVGRAQLGVIGADMAAPTAFSFRS
jgi:hypothetical protein